MTLKNITIPVGANAFNVCSNLISVTILASSPPNLGNGYVFSGTSQNLVVYVPSESVETYKAANGWSDYTSKIQPIPS